MSGDGSRAARSLPGITSADLEVFQGLIDALPHFIMLVDESHRILAANRAVSEALGQDPASVVGSYCPATIHGCDAPFPGCPLEQAVASGQRVVETEFFETGMGRWLASAVYLTDHLTSDGRRIFIHAVRDITEQRRAAEERARLQAELSRSQRLQSVGRLASGVAHDFKNYLTLILNYAGFVAERLDREHPVQDDLARIRRAANRAAALTRQLMTFGRSVESAPCSVDVDEVVAGIEDLLRRAIGAEIVLETCLEASPCRARIDPGALEQVLLNLVINARDAMPEGGRITVRTASVLLTEEAARRHVELSAGRHVLLQVEDSGTGMEAEVLAQVFDPFFTTKPPGKGAGLGLSTVYGIVKQAGGAILGRSEPGRATTFEVYLPVDEALSCVATLPPRIPGGDSATCNEATEGALCSPGSERRCDAGSAASSTCTSRSTGANRSVSADPVLERAERLADGPRASDDRRRRVVRAR